MPVEYDPNTNDIIKPDIFNMFLNTTGSMNSPHIFIMQSINELRKLSSYGVYVNVTFWLGKGEHFFFWCDHIETSLFEKVLPAMGLKLINWCLDSRETFTKSYFTNDNIDLHVRPMECNQ